MRILAVNTGSSSVKLQLIETDGERVLARAQAERIGAQEGRLRVTLAGEPPTEIAERFADHDEALAAALSALQGAGAIEGVGHRVVHGGDRFFSSVVVDDEVENGIASFRHLAPLHTPPNLAGIRAARRILPNVTHVAVFDTAFHATLPRAAYTYALPFEIAERWKIRRYGFHGISHRYIAQRTAEVMGRSAEELKVVSLHLGNGASACAIDRGRSVDSSMGMTPMEGLVMGSRAGDLDPAIVLRLAEWEGHDTESVDRMLNFESGLLGVSGVSLDMRTLLEREHEGHDRAGLAVEVFCHRVRRYIGAFYAVLNGADAIVFTGGIGENAVEIRARICANLEALGIAIDHERNRAVRGSEADIATPDARTRVWVIPANEELLIARDAARLIRGA